MGGGGVGVKMAWNPPLKPSPAWNSGFAPPQYLALILQNGAKISWFKPMFCGKTESFRGLRPLDPHKSINLYPLLHVRHDRGPRAIGHAPQSCRSSYASAYRKRHIWTHPAHAQVGCTRTGGLKTYYKLLPSFFKVLVVRYWNRQWPLFRIINKRCSRRIIARL